MADRQRLNSQVTLRLDDEFTLQLRKLAQERDMKITSLLRQWIETMYVWEVEPVSVRFQIEEGGHSGEPQGRNITVDVEKLAKAG